MVHLHAPDTRKAVVAVFLAREHLPFIRDWCIHHAKQGWSVCLYDNSGSQGSARLSSIFTSGKLQRSGYDKAGRNYASYSADLSDVDVRQRLLQELAGLDVELRDWQPRNEHGEIMHGQVGAYVDFIGRNRRDVDWAAFIDCDEYLTTGAGLVWDALLDRMEGEGVHRALIRGVLYEIRWDENGQPRPRESLCCVGSQEQPGESYSGSKNIVRLSQVERADIHWLWQMRGKNSMAVPDVHQFHFRHYRSLSAEPRFQVSAGFTAMENRRDESEPA